MKTHIVLSTALGAFALASGARAAEIFVTADIAVSTTWTANNTYNLQNQIYVLPGATLTIDAGTVVASTPTVNGGGALAVCRGAQIFVNGTLANPVIMTSTNDVATWVGGDPKTGTWREAANEWGNLTIMGDAYVAENIIGGNTAVPNAANYGIMEGLTEAFPGDTRVRYGGGNDDDDSGSVSYLSLRYGGRVIGLGSELNGMSLGGIGRATEIDHVEIMNNVDDGFEIWGGTVNLKYFSVWNVGDDSVDVDQGWRGKAQFGLIVQGYSVDAAQGSGVGDNCFETDGAEQSDYQPVTTATIYNCTVIGQPIDGDHGTAWRDNARVQYRNSIFMDLGERLVGFDNLDGDGGQGYGFNGTLSWANTWTTAYNAVPAHANDFTTGTYATNYAAQSSGNLAEITDSVFFRNLFGTAYTEATARGVFGAGTNNVLIPGFAVIDTPITSLTRGPLVVKGGKQMLPVIGLDPRPVGAAATSVAAAPLDGFFTAAQYRGAFSPFGDSWICGWTASFAFGFTTQCDPGVAFCTNGSLGIDHTTACPCGNTGLPGNGCGHSFDANGANMSAFGSIDADTVVLHSQFEPASSFTLMMQHAGSGDAVFHDGVLCAGNPLIRLRGRSAVGGEAFFPNSLFANDSTTTLSQRGSVTVGSGVTRRYAGWYRNASTTFCPPATANVTNGWQIVW